jgi:hypothetical protein
MILFPRHCKKHFEKTSVKVGFVLGSPMRMVPDRAVLTVARHDGVWRVEFEGKHFGHSRDKEIAKAAANRQAREIMDGGKSCEVRISGEHGFWAA